MACNPAALTASPFEVCAATMTSLVPREWHDRADAKVKNAMSSAACCVSSIVSKIGLFSGLVQPACRFLAPWSCTCFRVVCVP